MIGRGSEIIIPNSICKIFWLNAFNGGPTAYRISIFIIVWWIVFLSDSINQHKKIIWRARRQTDDAEKTKGIVTTCDWFSHLWPLEVDWAPRGPCYSVILEVVTASVLVITASTKRSHYTLNAFIFGFRKLSSSLVSPACSLINQSSKCSQQMLRWQQND